MFKRCGCTRITADDDGRGRRDRHGNDGNVGQRAQGLLCPLLGEDGHGSWWYQIDLPHRANVGRRRLRRGGLACRSDAEQSIETVRALLAIPDHTDERARLEIADLVQHVTRRGGALPDPRLIAEMYRQGLRVGPVPTVAEWLDRWMAGRRALRPATRLQYQTHIRLSLKPYLGHLRIDELRVDHLLAMYDQIDARNTTIRDTRAAADHAGGEVPGFAVRSRKMSFAASAVTRHRRGN